VIRPRAADDFDTIHRRVKELRREAAAPSVAKANQSSQLDAPPTHHEAQLRERREGLPPPWVPTIFLKTPANGETARRFGEVAWIIEAPS
jgi:hypothetical protein